MASKYVALPSYHEGSDVSTNPEIIMMMQEGDDDDEADVSESIWLAGNNVTKPKQTNYEGN